MGCYFPEDLVVSIILRLPVNNCLVRFRLVSKSWCSRLSDLSFIYKLIFSNSDGSPQHFLLNFFDMDAGCGRYTFISGDTLQISTLRDLPNRHIIGIVGSSNGLICIKEILFDRLFLWNPATSETKFIPKPECHDPTTAFVFDAVGFGFDPKTEDYKVARIGRKGSGGFDMNFVLQLYRVKNDSWKELDVVGFNSANMIISSDFGGLNSVETTHECHWWANDGNWDIPRQCVISFDMTTEIFKKTFLPDFDTNMRILTKFVNFFRLENSLAMIRTIHHLDHAKLIRHTHEIWILLKPGVKESWLKLYTLQLFTSFAKSFMVELHQQKPLQFTRNGQVFLVDQNGQILLCDPPTQKITTLPIQINYGQVRNFEMVVYKESLMMLSRN